MWALLGGLRLQGELLQTWADLWSLPQFFQNWLFPEFTFLIKFDTMFEPKSYFGGTFSSKKKEKRIPHLFTMMIYFSKKEKGILHLAELDFVLKQKTW